MGMVVFPVFDREDARVPEPETSGELLARFLEDIDDVASKAGLPGLSAFADPRSVPDGFDGSPEDLEALMGPSTAWYECRAGSAALSELASRVGSEPSLAACVPELSDLAKTLDAAARLGLRFRLEMT